MALIIRQLLAQPFDGLIIVDPDIQVLDQTLHEIKSIGIQSISINKELSDALKDIPAEQRGRFARSWLKDTIAGIQQDLIVCSNLDLLFHPSFKMDPFALICQLTRLKKIVFLWPGNYSSNVLSYAIPIHHHYRTWEISDDQSFQPKVIIQQISDRLGE